jgi:hypothetical protein
MNFDARDIIQRELESGERLIWAGQPLQGIRFRRSDMVMILFSLLWGGFALFWEWTAIQNDAPFPMMLFGIPFVLIGLYIMVGRFFLEARQREKTFYGVSNERILIVSGLTKKRVTSLNLRTLSDLSLAESVDGQGTITFGSPSLAGPWFGRPTWPGLEFSSGTKFDLLKQAKTVYQHIREAQKALASRAP